MASDLQLLESIASANYFIDKLYLDDLTQYEPCALSEINRKNRFLRFCQIEKIMYDADEDVNDKLISVYGALAQFVNNVVLLIVGSKTDVKLYIQPLTFGGQNEASNITPMHASEHFDKQGVHAPDSPFGKIDQFFKEE